MLPIISKWHKHALATLGALTIVAVTPQKAVSQPQGHYSSDILKEMSEAMKITGLLDTISDGIHVEAIDYKGKPVTIISENGKITHIGYSVFLEDIRRGIPSPFYNMMERYALLEALPLKRQKTVSRELYEEGFNFSKGSLGLLPSLYKDSTIIFSLDTQNGKKYNAEWRKGDNPVVSMTAPVSYDLHHGTNMDENERRILEDLQSISKAPFNKENFKKSPISREDVITYFPVNYYILPGESYYFDNFNTNRYYTRTDSINFNPIFSNEYPMETLANLCTGIEIENRINIDIKLIQYGHKKPNVNIPLSVLVEYCLNNGCTPFFGVIGSDKNTITAELLMRNAPEGYCHNIKITAPLSSICNEDGPFKARMNPFIPISKISSLFDDNYTDQKSNPNLPTYKK